MNYIEKDVRILFVEYNNFLGKLISLVTFGSCNHVALLIGGDVYSMETEGIRIFSKAVYYDVNKLKESKVLNISSSKAIDFLNSKSTIKYDWLRSILWPLRKLIKFRDKIERWNCVEMVYYTLKDQQVVYWDGSNISPSKLEKIVLNKG